MERHRVQYYWSLQQIENLLRNFDTSKPIKDINDALELYHIIKHIDNENHPSIWKEDYIDSLKSMVKDFPRIIVRYLQTIPKDALYDYYKLIDWSYTESF